MATETLTNTTAFLGTQGKPDEAEHELKFPNLPTFPSDIPTAPLHRLSLKSLRSSPEESQRLFQSCKDLGFFYLDLRGDPEGEKLLDEANQFFDLAPKFYNLGRDELQKYDYKSRGSYMGYKGFGNAVVDEKGNLDRNEFYNIPKDDFLSISKEPFAHPQLLYDNQSLITSYIRHSHALVTDILSHLNTHLHLPPSTLQDLHALSQASGDQIRMIKSPPQPASDLRTSLGKHTDFGSITLLFNRLGGLQILPPPSLVPKGKEPEWTYVQPLPGHCIVNLGDAMVKFTRGVLRSNIHRVVSPPGEQAKETRYSVVYFSRPGDEIPLKALSGGDVIPEGEDEETMSAKDWILLQAMRLRKVDGVSEEERKKLWEESGRGQ
ncbi:putative oxidoreductase [Halenospora varia]|nr:putative oxidoreductase [Halenospora varia]